MNDLTHYEDDDGFGRSLRSDNRLLKGQHARWTDSKEWHDRDELPIPSPLLVIGVKTALQSWKDRVPTVITDTPLPDPDELNAAIPQSEWELGLDNKPRPPWAAVFVVYMVNENTGQMYTAVNSTTGWRMAFDALTEAVTVKRMLHGGARMLPIVDLQSRPFKTSFGDRKRPHLQIVDWRSVGGGAPPLPTAKPPQLTPPAAAEATKATSASAAATAATHLTDLPKPVSSEEYFSDEVPW
jgi:hypothetical protein